MKADDPEVLLKLENEEVLAFFSLGQMHKKVVRFTDNFFGNTKVGVFCIEELNGETELDFSDHKDWLKVEINSIKISLTGLTGWGEFKDTYPSLLDIKCIELLEG